MLNVIEVETQPSPSASIIWLHGLGASGHDFEPIIPEFNLPVSIGLRFIFPHAPTLPVTVNGGIPMPAWYDILSIDIDRVVDQVQLAKSAQAINALIEKEVSRGIPSHRVFIAGFSQGGAVAYEVALTHPKTLGGCIALSTYLATKNTIEYHSSNQQLPLFIGHGGMDNVVPESLGQQAVRILQKEGYTVDYKTYPMDHSVCMEEINDISQWLQQQLAARAC